MTRQNTDKVLEQALSGEISRRGLIKKAGLLGLSVPIAASILAACEDDDDDGDPAVDPDDDGDPAVDADDDDVAVDPDDDDEPVDETDDDEEAPDDARYGGRLTIAYVQTVTDIDITTRNVGSLNEVAHYIYETLFDRETDGTTFNLLVADAEISDDGTVHTWELQSGVTFHDGSDFNAEAVKWNLDRKIDNELTLYDLIPWDEIEVVDELTLQVTLTRPSPAIYQVLAAKTWSIVSPSFVEEHGEEVLNNEASGTGPFVLEEHVPAEMLRMPRNEDYWQDGLPYLDEVVFQVVPDPSTRATMLEAGEAQMSLGLSITDLSRFQDTPGVKVLEGLGSQQYYMALNNQRGAFQDVEVRQAANYAIDKQAIIDAVFLGDWAEPATAPYINSTAEGYAEGGTYEYDQERARELLEEAGWTENGNGVRERDGERLHVNLYGRSGAAPGDTEIVELVQAMLTDVGFEVEAIIMDSAAFLDAVTVDVEDSEYDMINLTWGTFTGDAEYVMLTAYHCDSWAPRYFNRAYFCSDEVDGMIEDAQNAPTLEERNEIFAEIIPMVTEQAPILMLVNVLGGVGVAENLEGVYLEPASINWPAKFAWLED